MEYCEGTNILQYISKEGAVKEETGRAIAVRILETIKNAHADKVVHRDIKPQTFLPIEVEMDVFSMWNSLSRDLFRRNARGPMKQ